MSYIIKAISFEDNKEIKKINAILKKFNDKNDDKKAEDFIEKLEEKGYIICKKVLIDN